MTTSNRLRSLLLLAALWVAALPGLPAGQVPIQNQGAAGAWQKLRKLSTTASVLHTTAHPDDEHGGLLAWLGRGQGAAVSMLTLTRGESGDNAIGSELFDALGLVRTEELLLANRYYGVDRQYFGTVADYGYSKRLDEAIEKWGREHVLRDVVRVIRIDRPLVVISRFQGTLRDGHGNHSAAGLITRDAFRLAGDPAAFPEQAAEGLRPWQPLKLYIGGVRENEPWTIRVDTGEYDPVLGESYQTLGRLGLSVQRSQTSGRFNPQPGPSVAYYQRVDSVVDAPAREQSFFDGLDATIPGLYRLLKKTPPDGAAGLLEAIDREVRAAVAAFEFGNPSASAPALARALAATRAAASAPGTDPDVAHVLAIKERQIAAALHAALGVVLTAVAQPPGTKPASGPFSPGPPAMGPVVPGQTFEVLASFTSRGTVEPDGDVELSLSAAGPWVPPPAAPPGRAARNQPLVHRFSVDVPDTAPVTRPHFARATIQDARYQVLDAGARHDPWSPGPLDAVVRYRIAGVPVELRRPVTRLEASLPYGHVVRELAVVPALSVTVSPAHAIAPRAAARPVAVTVEVLNNRDDGAEGTLRLAVPPGWTAEPAVQPFQFARAGERALFAFDVRAPALDGREHRIEAIATAGGREHRDGYTVVRHRDLETRYLYRDAVTTVRGIDVTIAQGLKVGYVMGVGDDVPSGLAQLGAAVVLVGEQDLATGDLARFDAIVTGTRAYAVREDLKTYNRRLLDYVRGGGNLIVLYNTQEFVPRLYAPYPAELPAGAEEVSEEDSPVEILAPGAPVLNTPNRITPADFDGWVEQRGSKFWSSWDERYTPLLATWDTGQAPQRGGWLHARYGKGHYTYFAYAFHRQLPYGVPGAYRLLANLLSLNQGPASGSGR